MPWGIAAAAVIAGGAAVYSANKSSNAVEDASNASIAAQNAQLSQSRADTAVSRAAGNSATYKLAKLYGLSMPAIPLDTSESNFDQQAYLKANPDYFTAGYTGTPYEHYLDTQDQQDARAFTPINAAITGATTGGAGDLSGFTESPDYQFNLSETQKAVDRSAAARGGALSGRAVKESQRYASNLASGEFSNYYNRLAGIAGLGQNATTTAVNVGTSAANNNSAALVNAGNSRASGYVTAAQGVNNAVQGGISNALLYKYTKTG